MFIKKFWFLFVILIIASVAYLAYFKIPKALQGSPPAAGQASQTNGMVSINFDDGNESAYQNALPILEQAGIKATFYIITKKRGKNYMTDAQILDLYTKGHEIGSHTQTHPYLTRLSSQHQMREIQGSRTDLLSLGIKQVDTFAYPYGLHNPGLEKFVADAGFAGGRATVMGTNNSSTDRYALNSLDVKSDFSFITIQQAIDQAIEDKQWLILTFHRIDESGNVSDGENVSHEILQQTVSYLKDKHISVVTTSEGLQLAHLIK